MGLSEFKEELFDVNEYDCLKEEYDEKLEELKTDVDFDFKLLDKTVEEDFKEEDKDWGRMVLLNYRNVFLASAVNLSFNDWEKIDLKNKNESYLAYLQETIDILFQYGFDLFFDARRVIARKRVQID